MKKVVSALLVGASLLAAAPASAADFIRYTFVASGTAEQTKVQLGTTISQPFSSPIDVTVPAAAADAASYTAPIEGLESRPFTLTKTATGFTFVTTQSAREANSERTTFTVNGTICLDAASGCRSGVGILSSSGGIGLFFFGAAAEPTEITRFTADSARIGVTFFPSAVPEPTTWAVMLIGFGMIGAALRRPKARAVVA